MPNSNDKDVVLATLRDVLEKSQITIANFEADKKTALAFRDMQRSIQILEIEKEKSDEKKRDIWKSLVLPVCVVLTTALILAVAQHFLGWK